MAPESRASPSHDNAEISVDQCWTGFSRAQTCQAQLSAHQRRRRTLIRTSTNPGIPGVGVCMCEEEEERGEGRGSGNTEEEVDGESCGDAKAASERKEGRKERPPCKTVEPAALMKVHGQTSTFITP